MLHLLLCFRCKGGALRSVERNVFQNLDIISASGVAGLAGAHQITLVIAAASRDGNQVLIRPNRLISAAIETTMIGTL